MDSKYVNAAMLESGYADFSKLPPHEQSRIMRRAQALKLAAQDQLVPATTILGGALWYLSYYPDLSGPEYRDNCEARKIIAEAWATSHARVTTATFWGAL